MTALAGVPTFVRNAFGDQLLRRANHAAMIDIEAIEDQDCYIPHITMTTFVESVARLSGEEHFGMMLAPHLTITRYGCWSEYILAAPTLDGAIERAIATLGFHSKGDDLSVAVEDGEARLRYTSAAKGQHGYRHVACGAAGVIASICRIFLPANWRPRRVELDIPKPRRPGLFEDAFECPIVFDAPTIAVCLAEDQLRARSPQRVTHSLITVEDLARARVECRELNGLQDVIAQQVWSQVLAGRVSIESAARSLDTSVRTLQRELNRESIDFRTIVNVMRSRRAIELLRGTDASITNISMALGYSAPAHFARAFLKATGQSPRQFRRRSAPMVGS